MANKKGEVTWAVYRSVGPQLTVDSLEVIFKVDGEKYRHPLPNKGWGYQTPALAFMGYMGIKPTDFSPGSYSFDGEEIPVEWNEQQNQYLIRRNVLTTGAKKLQDASWFDPNGTVWNSDGSHGMGGINIEPSTGNRAKVEGKD